MRILLEWIRRSVGTIGRGRTDADLRDELRLHADLAREDGKSAAGAASAMDALRDQRGLPWLDDLTRDMRHTGRMLRREPGFAMVAVLVLALGIGASTAVFSVVHAVVLKPLPFPEPDRLVAVRSLWTDTGAHGQVSLPDFDDWRDQSTSFDAIALYKVNESAIAVDSNSQFANTTRVTDQFFAVFDVPPLLGRTFNPDETAPGSGGAAIVSDAFWRTRLGGDPSALGRSVVVAGRPLTVVGVMPAAFVFPEPTDIWIPEDTVFRVTPANRGSHNYLAVGRLRSGVGLEAARAEMRGIGDRLEQQYLGTNRGKTVWVGPLVKEMVGDVSRMLYLLLGAVFVLLLIACVNVANLLVARAAARTREMGVRAALGAGRARLVRQLVAESLVLGAVSGLAGLLIGRAGTAALVALSPATVPRLGETGIDAAVGLFSVAITLAASLVFGLAPAVAVARRDVLDALRQASRGPRDIGSRLRRTLVVAEIALSVVLLIGAGLLIRSFERLTGVDLGFTTSRVLVMETSNPLSPTAGRAAVSRVVERYRALLDDIATLPAVDQVAVVRVPPGAVTSSGAYVVDGAIAAGLSTSSPQAVYSIVGPQAFAVLGIPILAGRDFSAADGADAPRTAIVNEALARAAFPGQDALGHSIVAGMDSFDPMTIVGVVGDVRQRGPGEPVMPEIYMPYEQHQIASTALRILVRTSLPPETIAGTLRQRALALSPGMPVNFTTMNARVAGTVAVPRFRTLLLAIFAGIAVVLTMAGVYGVLSFLVSQRAQEIGVRMALGANPAEIVWMIVGRAVRMAAIGLLIGLTLAAAAARLMGSMLFEVHPFDPSTYAAVAIFVMIVTVVACTVPARRAAQTDPAVALRAE